MYIDISKLNKVSSNNIDAVVAVDKDGEIIKAALDNYVTEDKLQEELENIEIGDINLSNYYTKEEINDIVNNIDNSDKPYVIITTVSKNNLTLKVETGDLDGVINAIINRTPFTAYFYNKDVLYGLENCFYEIEYITLHTQHLIVMYYHCENNTHHTTVGVKLKYDSTNKNYYLDSLTRDTHLYATAAQVIDKQDKLVSGENIKTINGNSILGSGDITITGSGDIDLSNYYTKEEINNNYQPKGDYLTSIPSEYVTETELSDKGYITNNALNGYATETYVANGYVSQPYFQNTLTRIEDSFVTDNDLLNKGYITETELNDAIEGLGGSDIPYVVIDYAGGVGQVIAGDLNSVLNSAKNKESFLAYFYNTSSNLGNYYTLYPFTAVQATDFGASLSFHYEESSTQHKTVSISCSFNSSTSNYKIENVSINTHNYLTSIPSEYITETELNNKGYLTSIPTDYATKQWVENNFATDGDVNDEIGKLESSLQAEINSKQPKGDYLTSIPSEYVTETELNDRGYATKSEIPTVPTKTSELTNDSGFLTSVPSEYITESELNDKGYLTSVPTEYITETELNDKGYITNSALSGYATETYVNNQIGDINTILEQIIG